MSGGSSGAGDSQEARNLYQAQADTANFMLGQGKQYIPQAAANFNQAAQQYNDPAFEAKMVGQAGADAAQASNASRVSMGQDLARYGINPNSGRFAALNNQNAVASAGMQAGAMNKARDYVQNARLAVDKDYFSSLTGQQSNAMGQLGQAANGFAGIGAQQNQIAAQNAAGWGQAVGTAGTLAYSMMKDGGPVRRKHLYLGGPSGGLVGGVGTLPTPSPQAPSQQQSGLGGAMQGISSTKSMMSLGSKLAGATPTAAGAPVMGDVSVTGALDSAFPAAVTTPANSVVATGGNGVAGALESAFPSKVAASAIPTSTAAAIPTSTAAAIPTSTAALAAPAAAPGVGAAMSAIGTALPWVGAALAVGSLFGLELARGGAAHNHKPSSTDFAKRKAVYEHMFHKPYKGTPEQNQQVLQTVQRALAGAQAIQPAQGLPVLASPAAQPEPTVDQMMPAEGSQDLNMKIGGNVKGPGTSTSDSIPAMLSNGEYVNNAASTQMKRDEVMKPVKKWLKGGGGAQDLLATINKHGLTKRGAA